MTSANDKQSERCWVVIPAAGIGARMGANVPKQYLPIDKRPILAITVSALAAHPMIEKAMVVLNVDDQHWSTLQFTHPDKIVTTVGGELRVNSVLAGLQALSQFANANDWVLVHDAVRPCVTHQDIDRLIQALQGHAVGGLLGIPVADTLKKIDDQCRVIETVARESLWRAQTPQMFRLGVLQDALQKSLKAGVVVTDEASAIEFVGLHPLMVQGDPRNIKITHPQDLQVAQQFLMEERDAYWFGV